MTIKRTANINGTSLKGTIKTTYNRLVEVFGEPCLNDPPSEHEKVTTEWDLVFPCGTVATIYNRKNYGTDPAPHEDYDWHVGGYDYQAFALVSDALKN